MLDLYLLDKVSEALGAIIHGHSEIAATILREAANTAETMLDKQGEDVEEEARKAFHNHMLRTIDWKG